jgi:hypothetical protein
MPTYTNTSSGTIKIGDTSIPPGETITLNYYVKHDSLTLTLHTPRVYPIKTIKSGTIDASAVYLVDLDYPKVCVLNESGEDTEVWFNDYSLYKFKLFSNTQQIFDNEGKNIGSVHVSGEGVANIRVTNMY